MRPFIAYTYRVSRRGERTGWSLSVVHPSGRTNRLTNYADRRIAISAAHLLAGRRGHVEVLP